MSDDKNKYDEIFKDMNMDALLKNNPITEQHNDGNQPLRKIVSSSGSKHGPFHPTNTSGSIRDKIRKYSTGIVEKASSDDEEETVDTMISESTWDQFRNTGLLWFINSILHAFGWAIVMETDNGTIVNVYPARVKFRGFSEDINTNGYKKIAKYMKDNAEDILDETNS